MTNKIEIPQAINNFISAVNSHDSEAYICSFTDHALVNDAARNFFGKGAIKKWSDEEIIKPEVTFEIDEVVEHYGSFMITAFTNGNYDKTKTPDPLYLDYFFTIENGKILRMFIFLNKKKSGLNKL